MTTMRTMAKTIAGAGPVRRCARVCSVMAGLAVTGMVVSGSGAAAGQQGPASQWGGIYTADQAARGESLYRQSCAPCHGTGLEGGERAPALIGPAFVGRWSDRPFGDLFEYMRVMMPLQRPGGFSAAQNADILAYMLREAGYPAGAQDLPATDEALDTITFVAAEGAP